MKTNSQTIRYGAFIFLECLLWGFGNPIAKIVLQSFSLFYYLGLRYSVAAIILVVIFHKQIRRQLNRQNFWHCLQIGLFSTASFTLANLSLLFTEATIAGFLMALAVLFTPFISYFAIKRELDKRNLIFIAIVIVGMYFLCGNGGSFSFGWGELVALLSAVAFAANLTYSAKYVEEIGASTLAAMQSITAAVITLPLALIFESWQTVVDASLPAWGGMLYLILACTVAAYLLQNAALRHLTAVFASLALCSEPIFSAIGSHFLLGERLHTSGFLGAGLILLGIVLASLAQHKSEKKQAGVLREPAK